MSPFANYLKTARLQLLSMRQGEFAALLGYEQSYISGIEQGSKGPPTKEFVERLIKLLDLTPEETAQLWEIYDASIRKFEFPIDAPDEVYRLMHELRIRIPKLQPDQINALRSVLKLCA